MTKAPKLHSIFPKPIFLHAATRSPIGRFGGSLKALSPARLGSLTLSAALKRDSAAPDSSSCDFVLVGHARQAGGGPNTARQIAIGAGLPPTTPAITFNQACASGLASVIGAAEKIALGRARSIWAGGVESMSNTPYLLPQARWGQRLGNSEILDGMWKDGFFCPMSQMVMGETVERYIALFGAKNGVSRDEQDAFALRSQTRAANAWKNNLFDAEVFSIQDADSKTTLSRDEHLRPDTTLEDLKKLRPVFDSKKGTLTAGNSSGITDGAAFVKVSTHSANGPQIELLDYEITALDPTLMGLGPISATQILLNRQGLKPQDLAAIELNEAFAAQAIACQRELNFPEERLNARGGAIALGHPIGATGTRILVTLIHQIIHKPGALGLATLCVSGGMGVSVLIRQTS